jgi:type II secretory ATPase GspE/PulE/Tfp pilus assembly ATPase PilB-like protein
VLNMYGTVTMTGTKPRRSRHRETLLNGRHSTVTPVLLVTGPVGVGKSAVLHAADELLIEAQILHATVELEEIARH